MKGRVGFQQEAVRWDGILGGGYSLSNHQEVGMCVGGCLICSENLQQGSCGWSIGLKITDQFFGMQVTGTQLKGHFCSCY